MPFRRPLSIADGHIYAAHNIPSCLLVPFLIRVLKRYRIRYSESYLHTPFLARVLESLYRLRVHSSFAPALPSSLFLALSH